MSLIIIESKQPLCYIDWVMFTHMHAGLEKVPLGQLGQVDFPAGQVTVHSHLTNEQ